MFNSIFFEICNKEAISGVKKNHGGPFGAVIVKNGKIISKAHNTVIKDNDPTAHAEVNAIRKAGKKLKSRWLLDCELYSNCKPCPMCLSAIAWARIKTVYFYRTENDATEIGFIDKPVYDLVQNKKCSISLCQTKIEYKPKVDEFQLWKQKKDKKNY